MALNKSPLHMDPAIVKYNEMWINRHKYFRWTPRTAWLTFAYVVVVPSAIGWLGWKFDGKFDMRGKRRGDVISEY